jgi:hypothetical protein
MPRTARLAEAGGDTSPPTIILNKKKPPLNKAEAFYP